MLRDVRDVSTSCVFADAGCGAAAPDPLLYRVLNLEPNKHLKQLSEVTESMTYWRTSNPLMGSLRSQQFRTAVWGYLS